ncbi:MAG: helix-turn-helix transcriptional regulator [Angelakisella sp.]|nr:helix-turn-helix transcriptional regulator [Angelakisella sp.]
MIGKRLSILRKRAGLSQKELGDKLMVSHYTISSYEKDRSEPGDELKVRIAQVFDVSLDYLLGLIDTPLPFRREKDTLHLPVQMTGEQKQLIRDFITYWDIVSAQKMAEVLPDEELIEE